MKVFLTGATGFTGGHVLAALRRDGVEVRCLVRSKDKAAEIAASDAAVEMGDLGDVERLTSALRGCDTLINVASIGFGHAPGILRAAEAAGVDRAVFISTTAIFTQLNARSKVMRTAAERAIQESRLGWTIIRPTMIYGTARDRNIARLIRFVRRSPVIPVFGSGEFLMQPIYVADLADVIVKAAASSQAIGRDYNVSGREPLTYNELIRTIARLLGRRVRLLHLPHRAAVNVLERTERWGLRLPLKAEQILRLNENKAFDWQQAGRDLGFAPRAFAEGVAAEIRSMGLPLAAEPQPGAS